MNVTGAADMPSRFLEDAPTEIRDVLDWFAMGQARVVPPSHLTEFLGALHDDGAVSELTTLSLIPEAWSSLPIGRLNSLATAGETVDRTAV